MAERQTLVSDELPNTFDLLPRPPHEHGAFESAVAYQLWKRPLAYIQILDEALHAEWPVARDGEEGPDGLLGG